MDEIGENVSASTYRLWRSSWPELHEHLAEAVLAIGTTACAIEESPTRL